MVLAALKQAPYVYLIYFFFFLSKHVSFTDIFYVYRKIPPSFLADCLKCETIYVYNIIMTQKSAAYT